MKNEWHSFRTEIHISQDNGESKILVSDDDDDDDDENWDVSINISNKGKVTVKEGRSASGGKKHRKPPRQYSLVDTLAVLAIGFVIFFVFKWLFGLGG
ncbi:MAG: hypothetical protein ACK5LK_07145 [Chthoniobacterales bacterium]